MYKTIRKGEIHIMGNLLLLLFALPIATIIIASILETVLKNPIAVAGLAFAIYLIVAFAIFDASFLIYVILYTILAFVSAVITRAIINLINQSDDEDGSTGGCGCGCGNNNAVVINNTDDTGCGCSRRARYYNRYYR